MSAPTPPPQIAAVFGRQQGSGCLLTRRLVLTAAHVVDGLDEVDVVVPGGTGLQRCQVAIRRYGSSEDLAVLSALAPLTNVPCLLQGWGRLPGSYSWPEAQAIGFPQAARDAQNGLDTEQFTGELKTGSTRLRGTYVLDGNHAAPLPRADGVSPWAGMSGAPVFVDGSLVGLVREDPAGWGHSRLIVSSLRAAIHDPEFKQRCAELDYIVTWKALDAPDAADAFEPRLRDYLARSAGRLNIIGIGDETWPLDAGYLSLELLNRQATPSDSVDAGPRPSALRAEHALSGHRRALIRGTAGSGKTTLLQWLTATTARDELPDSLADFTDCIPLMLRLRTLIRRPELPSPEDFLSLVAKPLSGLPGAEGWITRRLANGTALLLVDGVDEVPEADRERTRAWLSELITAYPDVRYIVSTRPSAVREGWLSAHEFTELELLPMSRPDVTRFIDRWHNAATPDGRLSELRNALTAAVATKPDLGRLATNPLMCALICALNRDRRGFLPENRMELYAAALEMLLVRRDRERAIAPVRSGLDLSFHQQTLLLQRLAYWLITNGEAEMSADRARRIIADLLPSLRAPETTPEEVLDHLLLRSGLLRQPTLDSVDFIHRTFQDYLGSQALIENEDLGLLVRNAHDDQWRDVLRMAVHHARPRERAELLDRLLERAADDEPNRDRLHLVAAACLEHATSLDPAVRERVETAAATLFPPQDIESARALARCGPVVLDLLPDPEGLTDGEAEALVTTLTQLKHDRAIPYLARFTDHRSPFVRDQLAVSWSLFDIDRYADEVIARLVDQLGDEPRFLLESPQQLALLAELGGRARVYCSGDFTDVQLARLAGPVLQHLDLDGNRSPLDLSFLKDCPSFQKLALLDCTGGSSLRPLAGTGVRTLVVGGHNRLHDLTALADLSDLRMLSLNHELPAAGLRLLPSRLEELYLASRTVRSGLHGLEHLQELSFLRFPGDVVPPDDASRSVLAELPRLTSLALLDEHVGPVGHPVPPAPRIRRLTLRDPHFTGDLSPLAESYPGLAELDIAWYSATGGPPVDLSGLDRLPGLSTVRITGAAALLHRDRLPSSVHLDHDPHSARRP